MEFQYGKRAQDGVLGLYTKKTLSIHVVPMASGCCVCLTLWRMQRNQLESSSEKCPGDLLEKPTVPLLAGYLCLSSRGWHKVHVLCYHNQPTSGRTLVVRTFKVRQMSQLHGQKRLKVGQAEQCLADYL